MVIAQCSMVIATLRVHKFSLRGYRCNPYLLMLQRYDISIAVLEIMTGFFNLFSLVVLRVKALLGTF